MNIFKLAIKQVELEGKLNSKNEMNLILDKAIKIRKYLDLQVRNKKVAINRYRKK